MLKIIQKLCKSKKGPQTATALLMLLFTTGCVAHVGIYDPGPVVAPAHHVNVPPGHMPPPGQCRVWFPNRPPGQQPPPGRCEYLQYQVPPGAYLIEG